MYDFTTIGAVAGLAIAIVLIIRKVHPAYSLILGALVGGIIGSGVNTSIGERMKLIPFEACAGLTATLVSVVMFLIFG